jgi:hypothetical protein
MLSFVQQILAFTTFEVLEPNWRALESKLDKVTTVDQLLKDHVDFLDTCLKECMLTSSKLLRVGLLLCFVGLLGVNGVIGLFTADCDVLDVCTVYVFIHKICKSGHCSVGDGER